MDIRLKNIVSRDIIFTDRLDLLTHPWRKPSLPNSAGRGIVVESGSCDFGFDDPAKNCLMSIIISHQRQLKFPKYNPGMM
jgi:hypothetical protein